jgi:hypothetical protein
MSRFVLLRALVLGCTAPALLAATVDADKPGPEGKAQADLGVEVSELSPVIANPYVAFASMKRAVFEGEELDTETGEAVEIRVEVTVRDVHATVAGVEVTVVEVSDFEDGELVEKTEDYYAQHRSGSVYYIGEKVDDYDDGEIVSHGGQWRAGEDGARAGMFMPAAPKVGDVFETERAPGVAEDRSKVVAAGTTVTVPAGTYKDCIETEDFDPIGKTSQRKCYCRGVGLVQEIFGEGKSLQLVELEAR